MTCLKIQVPLPEKYVRTGPAILACSEATIKNYGLGDLSEKTPVPTAEKKIRVLKP
jgi:hypothetical protein